MELPEQKKEREDDENRGEQRNVEVSKNASFGAEGFVGEHRGQALQNVVQVIEEQKAGEHQEKEGHSVKRDEGQPIVPVNKGRESEVDQGEELCAIQGVAPNP